MSPELIECIKILDPREHPNKVDAALKRLEVAPGETFLTFYRQYQGPFDSEFVGYILADLIEGDASVENLTELCREHHHFPKNCLVITDIWEDAVHVYNTHTGVVYQVDFENGATQLAAGTLRPTWSSFDAFLGEFFLG